MASTLFRGGRCAGCAKDASGMHGFCTHLVSDAAMTRLQLIVILDLLLWFALARLAQTVLGF